MPASRSGTRDTSMSSPTSPLDAISDELESQPGRAQVLQRGEQLAARAARGSTRAASTPRTGRRSGRDGRLAIVLLVELGGGEHRRAADPVAAGARAEQHEQVAHARGGAADQPLVRREPDAHRVDQAVVLVGGLEVDLAADGGHADRVAVVADARDGPVEQVARARRVELAEAQRVEHRDRPRADREDVAQDAADAGGRALERLDRARVVVGLDLEGDRQPVARRRPRRRSRPVPSAGAGPRSGARAAASSSACRRSARTTSARTPPARARSARARGARRCGRTRRRSGRARDAER